MNWNPVSEVGFGNSLILGSMVVGWNQIQQWQQILGGYVKMAIDYYKDGDVVNEEDLINAAEELFDQTFDTAEKIANPLQTLKTATDVSVWIVYGFATALGLGTAWYLDGFKKKRRFITSAVGWSMAYVGGTYAVLSMELVRMSVEGASNMIGDVDPTSRESLKKSMVDAIKHIGLPQENVGDNL